METFGKIIEFLKAEVLVSDTPKEMVCDMAEFCLNIYLKTGQLPFSS